MYGIQITVPARDLVIRRGLDKKIEAALANGRDLPINFDRELDWHYDSEAWHQVKEKINRGELTTALLGNNESNAPWFDHFVFAYALTRFKDRDKENCTPRYREVSWYHGNHKRGVWSCGEEYLLIDSANLSSYDFPLTPWVNLDSPHSRRLRKIQADWSSWKQFLSILLKAAKQTGKGNLPEVTQFQDFLSPDDFGDWLGEDFEAGRYLETPLPVTEQQTNCLNEFENILPGAHDGSYPAYIHKGNLCFGLATRDTKHLGRRGKPIANLGGNTPVYRHVAFKPEELPQLFRATYQHYAGIRNQIPRIIEASGLVSQVSHTVSSD